MDEIFIFHRKSLICSSFSFATRERCSRTERFSEKSGAATTPIRLSICSSLCVTCVRRSSRTRPSHAISSLSHGSVIDSFPASSARFEKCQKPDRQGGPLGKVRPCLRAGFRLTRFLRIFNEPLSHFLSALG